MRKTVYELSCELDAPVGIYHDVEGCVTVIGPAVEDMEVGDKFYREDGGVLLVRGEHSHEDGETAFKMKFDVIEQPLFAPPAETPEELFHMEHISDEDYSDPEME